MVARIYLYDFPALFIVSLSGTTMLLGFAAPRKLF